MAPGTHGIKAIGNTHALVRAQLEHADFTSFASSSRVTPTLLHRKARHHNSWQALRSTIDVANQFLAHGMKVPVVTHLGRRNAGEVGEICVASGEHCAGTV